MQLKRRRKPTRSNSHINGCQNKQRYATKAAAAKIIADKKMIDLDTKLDTYLCSNCAGWHLTSREPFQT